MKNLNWELHGKMRDDIYKEIRLIHSKWIIEIFNDVVQWYKEKLFNQFLYSLSKLIPTNVNMNGIIEVQPMTMNFPSASVFYKDFQK